MFSFFRDNSQVLQDQGQNLNFGTVPEIPEQLEPMTAS